MKMKANIPLTQLKNHPQNVRKTYSDISELAESIRCFGILQNLTVVPEPGHEEALDSFYVVCGNRRLMAAREAGLHDAPCVITDMSMKDQVSTMMAENMSRSALTPIEEGQGIQLMLDLGETEEQITKKTGMSRSTIRHRLELAKLDPETVARKQAEDQEEGCYQLSLTDLYRLEKVKDSKKRNKILSEAKGPENLKFLVDNHLRELEQKETAKRLRAALAKAGIKKATGEQKEERYSPKYTSIQSFWFSDGEKDIKIPKHSDKAFYIEESYGIYIYDRKQKKEKTAYEMQQEKEKQEEAAFKKIEKNMAMKRRDFIRDVCAGKYSLIGNEKALWIKMISDGTWVAAGQIAEYLSDKKNPTAEEDVAMARETPVEVQMLAALGASYASHHILTWNRRYDAVRAEKLKLFYKILFRYGFSITDPEEKAVLYGTHEIYIRDEKNEVLQADTEAHEAEGDPAPVVGDSPEAEEEIPPLEAVQGDGQSGEAGDQMVDDDAEGGRPAPEGRVSVEEYLPLIAKVRESMGKLKDEEKAANWKEAFFHADLVRIAMNRLAQGVVLDPQKDIGLPAEREALEKSVTDLTDNLQRYINLGAWTAGKITAYKLTVTLKKLAEDEEDVSND